MKRTTTPPTVTDGGAAEKAGWISPQWQERYTVLAQLQVYVEYVVGECLRRRSLLFEPRVPARHLLSAYRALARALDVEASTHPLIVALRHPETLARTELALALPEVKRSDMVPADRHRPRRRSR